MSCRHSRWSWYYYTDNLDALTKRCIRCERLLPLGPAADDVPEFREAVAIEIRAAEIEARRADDANRGRSLPEIGCTEPECIGWFEAQLGGRVSNVIGDEAGYLARIIYEHWKEEA